MAGAYCKFCGQRCFVYRIVPGGPNKGWAGHMATCQEGMRVDSETLGCTHLSAVNPVTDPGTAEAVYGKNPYEAACDRFNEASENYPKAKAEAERILREAEEEYEAAQANLRQYEVSPGIPRPEYRD